MLEQKAQTFFVKWVTVTYNPSTGYKDFIKRAVYWTSVAYVNRSTNK